DRLSEHSGDVSDNSDETVQEQDVVFDQTPSDSSLSDADSEKSVQFDQSPDDSSSDDEEEKHINIAKSHLSPESFHFYFADRLEKLKEKRAAKEQQQMKTEDVVQNENVESVAEEMVETEQVKEEEKVIKAEKIIGVVEKIVEVIKPCTKCLESCKECAVKDEMIAEYEKKKEQLLFNLNYVKESYDVLNRTVTGLQKTNSEREQALTTTRK
ncbi:hypothetical protein L2164_21610, partial [Pectobacterium brasiliense]|nr:hypothetical protein [Pectobacterium brasiliense]